MLGLHKTYEMKEKEEEVYYVNETFVSTSKLKKLVRDKSLQKKFNADSASHLIRIALEELLTKKK